MAERSLKEAVGCSACNGTGIERDMFRCSSCDGVGPFLSHPGQPPWNAGEQYRYVGGTKVYRCYADYVDD